MKYLIVNGDDFGFSPGVNRGIVQAYKAGLLTSTTVMVNLAEARQIIEVARTNPALGVGVHLNITFGRPLLQRERVYSLLTEEGEFLRPEVGYGKVDPAEVREEWQTQIELLLSWGIKPTHLDSHHHVHTWPELRGVVAELAQYYRLPVRFTDPPTRQLLIEQGITVADHFIEDFYGEQTTVAKLMACIEKMRPGVTELMCHPAVVDQELVSHSSYTLPRNQELESLCSPQLSSELQNQGIRLLNYRQLAGLSK